MKKALIKDGIKEIIKTFKRFISILLVVLLGVGFFAGIKATSPDMKKTLDTYCDTQNFMDIQVISTLGLTNNDIETLKNVEGVENITGSYSADAIVSSKDEEAVIKIETASKDINKLVILEGKLPEKIDECVVEKKFLEDTNHKIGDTIELKTEKIEDDDGKEKELLKQTKLKIVGTVESSMYISKERGSSKLGSGIVKYYMYISPKLINTNIYTSLYITVKDANKLNCSSKKYTDLIETVEDRIEKIANERKEARYNEVYDKANSKIQEGKKELAEETAKAEKEIKDAEKKIQDAKEKIKTGKNEIENNKTTANIEFSNAQSKIENAEKELKEGKRNLDSAKKQAKKQISENKKLLKNLKQTQKIYKETKNNLSQKQKELQEIYKRLEKLDPITNREEIAKLQKKLQEISKEIYILNITKTRIEEQLQKQGIEGNSLNTFISKMENAISSAEKEIHKQEQTLNKAEKELKTQKKKLQQTKNETYAKLEKAEKEINNGEEDIKKNEKDLQDAKKEMQEKIADAKEELEKAQIKLDDIEKPEWYILNREQNTGYISYMQDTDRIANLATVFPIIFFVVAALISLTSMSRMVEEGRVQIGTLKALGYTKIHIASKYIIYALLATCIGGIIGLNIGFILLPTIIADMYANMYTVPKVILEFNTYYAFIGLAVALATTVGATVFSIVRALNKNPAILMRPKAPKCGKRVLLEKIPFIWRKLNFIQKVTARNIFRYKKRFLMTIIGVMGCTALILAGFGLKDAVTKILPSQYEDIFKYSGQITLKEDMTTSQIQKIQKKINSCKGITDSIKVNMQSVEIENIKNNQSIQLVVPENVEKLKNFITLRSRTKNNNYELTNNGIIITEKLAKLLDLKVGDSIILKNTDNNMAEIKIENITENYLMHYIYMSPELYTKLYNKEPRTNNILINTNELTEEQEKVLGIEILKDKDNISGISFLSNTENMFKDVMDNMNYVVLILIVSAGMLAFVVLYNLSNTNISERIRELATIKVLGFYDKEVNSYVERETNILTGIGIALGLVAGYFLTIYIITTCELDILMFDKKIQIPSYIYSALITIIFAVIVNITTYFTLKKVNMIESLKSVE